MKTLFEKWLITLDSILCAFVHLWDSTLHERRDFHFPWLNFFRKICALFLKFNLAIENLNANWNAFSLSLLQVIIVCYVYGFQFKQKNRRLNQKERLLQICRSWGVPWRYTGNAPDPKATCWSGILQNRARLFFFPSEAIFWTYWRLREMDMVCKVYLLNYNIGF